MASIAELFVRIRADTSDMSRGIASASKSLQGFENSIKRVSALLGGGMLGAAFLRNTIEAQNAVAQLNAVVKSTGGAAGLTTPQLTAMAGELQKVSTFSDEAIMGAQGLLLTFTKIRGDTLNQATKAVVDLAQAMGGDLRGAAIQVGKALQDPAQGLTALRRVGVSFSVAQQEIIKNLYATGHVAEAQAMILRELQKEFGGSALAARNTLGGALIALKNAFGDALEVSSNASTGIVGALNTIADAMPSIRSAFTSFFGGIELMAVDASIGVQKFLNLFRSDANKISNSNLEAWRTEQEGLITGSNNLTTAAGNTARAVADEVAPVKALTFSYNQLREEADRVIKGMWDEKKDWWKNYIDKTNEALSVTEELNRAINADRPSITEAIRGLMPTIPSVTMPNVLMPFEGLSEKEKESLRALGVLTDHGDKNTNKLHDAIWGSAAQLASTIVGALNIGGGGKGSSLGGSLGGTAGFALGFAFGGGPIGGAIGSTLGNIAGSFLGGLFDHQKKSVDTNTQALKALTQAIVQNTPTGFKVGRYRYDATDVQALGSATRRYASRGGVNPLLAGT